MAARRYSYITSLILFFTIFSMVLPENWLLFKNYILLPTLCCIVVGLIRHMKDEEKHNSSFRIWKISKVRASAWLTLYASISVSLGMCVYSSFVNNQPTSVKLLFIGLFLFFAVLLGKEITASLSKDHAIEIEIYNRRAVGKNRLGQTLFDADLSQSTFQLVETAVPRIYKGIIETEGQRFVISPDFVGFNVMIEIMQTHINWSLRNRSSQPHRSCSLELSETR